MAQRVVQAFFSMNLFKRTLLVSTLILVIIIASVVVTTAASGISFVSFLPANGSTVSLAKPVIEATVYAANGPLTADDVVMSLGKNNESLTNVSPTVAPGTSSGYYQVSYTPLTSLVNGSYTANLRVHDDFLQMDKTASWSFNVDAAPNIITQQPADNASVDATSVKIYLHLKDTYDNLNSSSVIMKFNGVQVTPRFTYKGHWEAESCSGSYFVIDSYQEGFVEYTATNLKDGVQNVELSIADSKGNVLNKKWSFTIAAKPRFSSFTPANGSLTNTTTGVSAISVKVTDDTAVDASTIRMTINNAQVVHTYDGTTGIITHTGSYLDGTFNVLVTATDTSGNVGTASWKFTASTDLAPKVISMSPTEGGTSTTASPVVTAYIKDTYDNLNASSLRVTFDGNSVTPSFVFKGHWEYDSCGGSYYVIDSYREGTMSFSTSNLTEGEHTVSLSMADAKGNVGDKQWKFKVGTPPKFTSLVPAANGKAGTGAKISAVVTDENGVNWDSVVLKVNGETKAHKLDTVNNAVYYDGDIADGTINVAIQASDLLNNPGSVTWSFSKDSVPPAATQWVPAKSGFVTVHNPKVSAYFVDAIDELNPSSVKAYLNDKPVEAQFQYKGYWASSYDSCTGINYTWYVIESKLEGTVSFSTNNLTDGVYTAKIEIADIRGNKTVEAWSFTVGRAPTFSNITPANGSEVKNVTGVSVKVTDDTEINWDSTVLKIDGSTVNHQIDTVNQIVYYQGSFPSKNYKVDLQVSDKAGNVGSTSWSFISDITPPSMYFLMYRGGGSGTAFANGLKITNSNFTGNLAFGAQVKDLVQIRRQVISTLQGTETKSGTVVDKPLDINIQFRGYTDSCTGNYIETYDNEGYFSYSGPIKDGTYTASLNLADYLGNDVTHTVNFTVESAPVITELAPIKYGVTDFTPLISAKVKDWNGTIVPESIKLTLNGTTVNHHYDATTGAVTFTPVEPLPNESYHTVTITAADDQGLVTTKTWKFYTNTYPDMADSNINNCTSCHPIKVSSGYNGDFERIHAYNLSFGGTHSSNDCDQCHAYVSAYADCYQCHGDPDYPETWNLKGHGDSPGIKYRAINTDPYFPTRILENREMWDCVICHQPGAGTLKAKWGYTTPTLRMNNHDIPDLHKAPSSDCSECHALSLTREHARDGRVTSNGSPITCNTCHLSADTNVKSAITNKNKNCSACHEQTNHEAVHSTVYNDNLDSNCQACHKASLTGEHLNNQVHLQPYRNSTTNYSCDTCHASTQNSITRTIGTNSLNCIGCHSSGHNLNMVEKVPKDIVLYEGFTWTTPMEAAIFTGDPTTPAGYEKGRVIQSNRTSEVTPQQVWEYYNTQLTAAGWSLTSTVPVSDAQYFTVEFAKAARLVTVKCYNTANSSGSGAVLGTKVEIWYK